MEILNDVTSIAQLSISLFLSIVFLQSGFDKIFNYADNLNWIKDHFRKTFLSPIVTPMFIALTLVEVLTGCFAAVGIFCILLFEDYSCTYTGLLLSLLSYIMLIFGQRIAQDYDGAKTIAIYFGVSLLGLLFFV